MKNQHTNPVSIAEVANYGKLSFYSFKDKDGLPQITVRCMTFDREGYLWVGTEDGAARYNGRSWKIVNMPNPTTSNFIYTMIAASDGAIYFGTSGGLSRLKNGQWTTFNIKSGLPNNNIHSLHESRANEAGVVLWIGNAEGGLTRLTGDKLEVINTKSILPACNVQCFLETRADDGSEMLWVGLDGGGLARLHKGRWSRFDTESGLPNNRVLSLLETRARNGESIIWVCTYGGGLARLCNGQWQVYDTNSGLPSNYTRCLLESREADGSTALWVCTYGGGLGKLKNGQWSVIDINAGLPCNDLRGIMESQGQNSEKSLWISIDGNGLAQMQKDQWTIFDTSNGLPNNIVYSLLETREIDGGEALWIGTYSGGLAKWQNGQWTIFDTSNSLPNNTVFCLAAGIDADGANILWAGTEFGLAKLRNGQWTIFDASSGLPANYIRCLHETREKDGTSVLWVGTRGGGVAKLQNNRWTIFNTRSGLPNNDIESLLVTKKSDGTSVLWVGTRGSGLAKLENGRWTLFTTKNGLPNDHIASLLEVKTPDGKSRLWIGTYGGAAMLDLDDKKAQWIAFTDQTRPALPNNTVYQVREDAKHRIYLCTNKGVARLTPRKPTPEDPSLFNVYTFTMAEGLPSNECNANASMVDHRGRIWVGTILGAAMFDPSKEIDNGICKPLYIERAEQLNGRPLNENKALAYDENSIVFEYALLNYSRAADTKYRIQLVGFDNKISDWSTQFRKEYTNLPEGKYIFQVWGKDYRGNISGPVEKAFTIKSAPWRSWWAYMIYSGALVSAAWGGIKYRMSVLEQRNMLLEKKISDRTKELAEALEEIKLSQLETERKNKELLESQKRADRIFSALAEALPGTVLDGKYRLDEKIGTGGFGVVYRGTHLSMKRSIAVKIFKPAPGNDSAENLERFRQEAVSACRINHINAVAVLDSGISSEGIAYLVMELLEGYPLTKELREFRALSQKRCVEILIPICDVLSKAHAAGIVHRDIKPDNIFLHKNAEGEVVKVVDFGIAKLLETTESLNMTNLTATGGIIGTPTYMAPERIAGQAYDGKSDVYSLGIMLYEMLCGRVPFSIKEGGFPALMLYHMTKNPAPLREINPRVSDAMEQVVMRTLEKDPEKRPTAIELAQEITRAAGMNIDVSATGSFKINLNEDDLGIENPTNLQFTPPTCSDEPTITVAAPLAINDPIKSEETVVKLQGER